ncbi:spondin domain-containing protein [Anthocerotibacter panamensis]|uniref:spondin domain-containing protein n=1 Tax=Anthocerotibacter panamensis TaxID=2857077 RepID=UPI001C407BCD|nr:spondin domain-containing protein [Anthocerotibacter panamensis]
MLTKFRALIVGFLACTVSALPAIAQTTFTVRIENLANPDGQVAKDGTKWPFALSPGAWVVSKGKNPLFTPGKRAGKAGLETQAEDGNPRVLAQAVQAKKLLGGYFNTPVGTDKPDAIGPGGSYEFTVKASRGSKLFYTQMFGQSNDLFYGTAKGIPLFDAQGKPKSGNVTTYVQLWDAGTEVNQEPGVGPDQAPRQKDFNTGKTEKKSVGIVRDAFTYPTTSTVLRVTITPQG